MQGKSAQECFNKIHADLATPPQHQRRSRAKKTNLSPVGTLAFTDKLVDDMDSRVKKARSSKGKSAAAQKTVRHLLRKHQMADRTHEADCFSVLESSPNGSIIELPQNGSPGTSDSFTTPDFLMKCSERSSSAPKKLLSRFKPTDADPSPEVLKRIKNVALHERYIDHLHSREARRRAYPKRSDIAAGANSMIENKLKSGILTDARASLITEARKVIGQFQQKQANALDFADDDDGISTENFNTDSDNDNNNIV